jgi:hypothetical protein
MVRDGVWEEMVRQAWRDYINTVNRDTAACHSVDIPFGLGLSKEKEKIYLKLLPETRLLPFFWCFLFEMMLLWDVNFFLLEIGNMGH